MRFLKKLQLKILNLSAAAIREIIAVTLLLCLSVVLSIPDLKRDLIEYQIQKGNMVNMTGQTNENAPEQYIDPDGRTTGGAGRQSQVK